MTDNNDELNELQKQWKAVEVEAVELEFSVPYKPQYPPDATVPIPISHTARDKASCMADLGGDGNLKNKRRRNLLATIVLHDYLRLQGYLPDLGASDCWNPILGRKGQVADLVVSQVGRFECCSMDSKQTSYSVPEEGQFGRSGYMIVEIDAEERWGWLLGFIPAGDEIKAIETLNRADLQSMDEFGHYLHRLWLLWNIVQERSEPWDIEMRAEMVALLERIYRTRSATQRPMRAAAEIEQMQLAGASREGDSPAQPELRQFLRAVFDRLEDALAIEEEAHNA